MMNLSDVGGLLSLPRPAFSYDSVKSLLGGVAVGVRLTSSGVKGFRGTGRTMLAELTRADIG